MKYLLMFLIIMLGALCVKDIPADWLYTFGYVVGFIVSFIACEFD